MYTHMVSIDGFIEADPSYQGPNWAISDEGLQQHFAELERSVDLHLYGRRVYEQVAAWWPVAASDPNVPPDMAAYGRVWIDKPKIVFSRTLDHADWNTRIVSDNAADEIRALKQQPGKTMTLYGGVLASSVLPLIDEYRFYVNPALLGRGTSMLPGVEPIMRLNLVETRPFDCGVVLLRYRA